MKRPQKTQIVTNDWTLPGIMKGPIVIFSVYLAICVVFVWFGGLVGAQGVTDKYWDEIPTFDKWCPGHKQNVCP